MCAYSRIRFNACGRAYRDHFHQNRLRNKPARPSGHPPQPPASQKHPPAKTKLWIRRGLNPRPHAMSKCEACALPLCHVPMEHLPACSHPPTYRLCLKGRRWFQAGQPNSVSPALRAPTTVPRTHGTSPSMFSPSHISSLPQKFPPPPAALVIDSAPKVTSVEKMFSTSKSTYQVQLPLDQSWTKTVVLPSSA